MAKVATVRPPIAHSNQGAVLVRALVAALVAPEVVDAEASLEFLETTANA